MPSASAPRRRCRRGWCSGSTRFVGRRARGALRERGARWLEQARGDRLCRRDARAGAAPGAETARRDAAAQTLGHRDRDADALALRHLCASHVLQAAGSSTRSGQSPSARERGTMIHEVFEQFVARATTFDGADALGELMAMARREPSPGSTRSRSAATSGCQRFAPRRRAVPRLRARTRASGGSLARCRDARASGLSRRSRTSFCRARPTASTCAPTARSRSSTSRPAACRRPRT